MTLIGESAAVAPTDGTAGADTTLSGSLGGLMRVGAAFSMPSAASMSSRIDEGVRELAYRMHVSPSRPTRNMLKL